MKNEILHMCHKILIDKTFQKIRNLLRNLEILTDQEVLIVIKKVKIVMGLDELSFTLQLIFKLEQISLKIVLELSLRDSIQQQHSRPRSCRFATAGYATCSKMLSRRKVSSSNLAWSAGSVPRIDHSHSASAVLSTAAQVI